jgi:hypothetical protein
MRVPRVARLWPVLPAGLLVALSLLAGCSPKNVLVPNLPPQTGIFVQGQVDTVNHLVHLYWFGTDADGFVVAYELRFMNPLAPADTQWVRTTRTDSLIAAFTPTGLSAPVFEVRAIDDDGAVDPTPATQPFTFTNQAPIVTFESPPGATDTTFASVTLRWFGADPDGDGSRMLYRVWLNGNQANPNLTANKFITIATDRFRQNGQLLSGHRTVYVQGIDDGGRAGNIDSTRWFVRAPTTGPRARLLIIDDVPSVNPANFTTDTSWTNTAARNLGADEWSLLRLEFTQPFRSSEDVRQTMALFENVIWYRGTQTTFSTLLRDYQTGIATYLDGGGRVFLEGLNLIQGLAANGPLTEDWVTRYMGSRKLIKYETSLPGDSSTTWGISNARILRSTLLADSLRAAGIFSGLRGFDVIDSNHVLLWAPPDQLTQLNQTNIPVALSVPLPMGGRMTIVTGPLRGLDGFRTVPRFLAKTFELLGLTGP